MPTNSKHIQIYGGAAAEFCKLKDEIEREWGYRPTDQDAMMILLQNWENIGSDSPVSEIT